MSYAAIALALGAAHVCAQDYPTRPVRVIITFPAGSATDIVGRVVTQKLTEYWGQNVLADNRGGAGGSIGSAIGVRSAIRPRMSGYWTTTALV
jgi:tripartite-type tricarboxylate transporter receptor subunit TctC